MLLTIYAVYPAQINKMTILQEMLSSVPESLDASIFQGIAD